MNVRFYNGIGFIFLFAEDRMYALRREDGHIDSGEWSVKPSHLSPWVTIFKRTPKSIDKCIK